jgi:hypothetical protein
MRGHLGHFPSLASGFSGLALNWARFTLNLWMSTSKVTAALAWSWSSSYHRESPGLKVRLLPVSNSLVAVNSPVALYFRRFTPLFYHVSLVCLLPEFAVRSQRRCGAACACRLARDLPLLSREPLHVTWHAFSTCAAQFFQIGSGRKRKNLCQRDITRDITLDSMGVHD